MQINHTQVQVQQFKVQVIVQLIFIRICKKNIRLNSIDLDSDVCETTILYPILHVTSNSSCWLSNNADTKCLNPALDIIQDTTSTIPTLC